jgi:hypothetical protein
MNIVKELNRISKNHARVSINETDSVLDSVKANLSAESEQDLNMLSFFGTAEVMKTAKVENSTAKNKLESGRVELSDIKKLCLNYGLRFLKASLYKKEIPLRALNDLRKFSEETKINPDKLKIIAPKSHFRLGARPAKDPVLVYDFGKSFKVISTWGDDFTFFRRVYGFFACYWTRLIIIGLPASFAVVSILLAIIYDPIWLVGLIGCIVTAVILALAMEDAKSREQDELWDREHV